jgi:DnaJ-class molecular chaperone
MRGDDGKEADRPRKWGFGDVARHPVARCEGRKHAITKHSRECDGANVVGRNGDHATRVAQVVDERERRRRVGENPQLGETLGAR